MPNPGVDINLSDTRSFGAGITPPTRAPSPAGSGPHTEAQRTLAFGFLRQMMRPLAGVVGDDQITLARLYPYQYTGRVQGTFGLRGAEPATRQSSYITVGNPIQPVSPTFGGIFYGRVDPTPELGAISQYRVRLMKHVDTDYDTTPPVVANLDDAGFFGLDAPDDAGQNTQNGEWRIRLERISDGTPVGGTWPSHTVYEDLDVELHVYTDSDDPIAAQPARQDGIFDFDFSTPGYKRAQLVRPSTGAILADDSPALGTIRSYRVAPGEPAYGTNFVFQSYTYDQAVALCAALASGEEHTARNLAGGLLALQVNDGGQSDGGFRFSGQQLSPSFGDQAFRTGGHAIALLALLRYMNTYPEEKSRPYLDAAQRALDYIETLRSDTGATAGMVLGGTGTYTGPVQVFEPNVALTWVSTEHHLDLYHAYAEAVRYGLDYATQRDHIRDVLLGPLWDTQHGRFYQGMHDTGPDTADALDLHSWGAAFLHAIGNDRALAVLAPEQLARFQWTTPTGITGYGAAYDSPGYEGMIHNVWSEGTLSLAYTFARVGDTARWRSTLNGILPDQQPDGSWRYVWRTDPTNDMTTSRSTIGAAWAVLALLGRGIW